MSSRPRCGRVLDDPPELTRPFVPGKHGVASEGDASTAGAVERELAEARERGYREGRDRAVEELSQEIEAFRREAAGSLERLCGLEARLTHDHEERLLEIVIETASRILRERIEQGDPVAARALREALDALPAGTRLRARLHPDDVDDVAARLQGEVDTERIELLPDPGLSRGGSVVESEVGRIDATVETAETMLREAVLGEENGA